MKDVTDEMIRLREIKELIFLLRENIDPRKPWRRGITRIKRETEVIISLTSYPARINSTHKTIRTLLHQKYLPDRVILWLAEEQFSDKVGIPNEILELQKYGLEIRWYHDIRSYKKLIPALLTFPNALIVTVDDDWYYRRDMLQILVDEHKKHPKDIICHDVTHPELDQENKLRSSQTKKDYRGVSSYFNKILSGSGTLFSAQMLDPEVIKENVFMAEAPTNDDIWFWAMAVKRGTKIRLAEHALGNALMTDADNQLATSLGLQNLADNSYEKVTNRMLQLYPEILDNLLAER